MLVQKLISRLQISLHQRVFRLILSQQGRQQIQHCRQIPSAAAGRRLLLQLLQILSQLAFRPCRRLVEILHHAVFQPFLLIQASVTPLPQLLLQALVTLRHKNGAQNLRPLLSRGVQQLPKFALGNHGNLLKLLKTNTQQLFYSPIDLSFSLLRRFRATIKHRFFLFLNQSLAPLFSPQMRYSSPWCEK